MVLTTVTHILTGALMLLQSVSTNPALPQSTRDEAQMIAERAITEATRAIAQNGTPNSSLPSCTLTTDKPNYFSGEVVVFSWTALNAVSVEFIPGASGIETIPVPSGSYGVNGVWRVVVAVKGYPFVTMKVIDEHGRSAACSSMIFVY